MDIENFTLPKLSLEDFQLFPKVGYSLGERTATQQSATRALMLGQGVEEYKSNVSRAMEPSSRPQFVNEWEDIKAGLWESSKQSLLGVLSDEDIPEQERINVLNTVRGDTQAGKYWSTSSMQALAETSVVSPPSEDVPAAAEVERDFVTPLLAEVVQNKRETQAKINAYRSSKDPTTASAVKDVAEIMVPFAEWIYFTKLQGEMVPEEDRATIPLLGNQKKAVFEHLKYMDDSEKAEITEKFIDFLDSNNQVLLPDGNDLVAVEVLEGMLLDNDYSDFERWFDNITSVMDVVGLGALVRSISKAGKGSKAGRAAGSVGDDPNQGFKVTDLESGEDLEISEVTVDKDFRDTVNRSTRTDVDIASPSQILRDTNPDAARKALDYVDNNGDEAAQAMYGTTRTEALAHDILPEAGDGLTIKNKVDVNKKPQFPENPMVEKARKEKGHLEITDAERDVLVSRKLVDRFSDLEGAVLHSESLVIATKPTGAINIVARYSPSDFGYSTSSEALEAMEFALRNTGVSRDSMDLYHKAVGPDGLTWKKVSKEDAAKIDSLGQRDSWSVGINYDYDFRPEDLEVEELLTTGGSTLTRVIKMISAIPAGRFSPSAMGQGSVVQHLVDPSSLIHPQIVKAGSVATDKAFGLRRLYQDQFKEFSDLYEGLGKDRRALMRDYINKANFEGIPFNKTDLYSRGFSSEEVAALEKWRRANDTMWYALNQDMVVTLRSRGYKVLVHSATDTKVIGRPTKSYTGTTKVYDPNGDKVTTMSEVSKVEDDAVVSPEFEVIELDFPVNIDGQEVYHAVARNTPDKGFTRVLQDDEVVLPYREGYYPIMYDANYFIEKKMTVEGGAERRVAIATAKTRKEVNHFKKRVMSTENLTEAEFDAKYVSRKDRSMGQNKNGMFDEGTWSMSSVNNITSQRVRGKKLQDASPDLHMMGNSNLKDPLEAVAAQVHSLAQRASARDFLETSKNRWMQNYGRFLDLPINPVTRKPEYPTSITQVNGKFNAPSEMVADARNNFNYLYSMENGFINSVDEGYKAVLQQAADFSGRLGGSKMEKALFEASKYSPVNMAKSAAFKLYISANPARQAVIQRGQMLMLPVANPEYFATRLMPDLLGINSVRAGMKADKKYVSLFKEIKDMGVLEAVDAHTLIRQDYVRLADLTMSQKAASAAKWPLQQLQKVGFDLAEQDVLLSAYLTFRDKAIRAGKNINDVRVREEALSEARMYTLNMNRSGDMPYTHNTLSLPGQFLTFQHKALLQGLTNRSLSRKQRASLLAYSTAVFGTQATLVGVIVDSWFDSTEPNEVKDAIKDGLLDVTLNQTLTALSGEDQAIDWGDMAPSSAYGMGNILLGMLQTDLVDAVANSPAGSLLFGGGRVADSMKTAARYFTPWDYEEPELQTTFPDVVIASANMFSGMSNIFKARYAFQTRKKMSSSGSITDEQVTAVEAVMTSLGFRTKDEEKTREMYEHLYGGYDSSSRKSDIEVWYKELKRHLARRGDNVRDIEIQRAVLSEAWRVFGEDRIGTMGILNNLIQKDADNKDYAVLNGLLKQMNYITEEEMMELVNKLPDNEVRGRIIESMETRKAWNQ